MWRSYFTEKKWLLWSWGGFAFIILSLLAQTYIDVKINEWYKGFYDLLQKAPERELSDKAIDFVNPAFAPSMVENYLENLVEDVKKQNNGEPLDESKVKEQYKSVAE